MNIHEKYIKRCIEIAKNGLGTTQPNPMVGSVIVYNNHIIGEGFTSPYGGNHAEVNAINAVKSKALLKEATLYVTLEPCSHFGKTPPCSDLIVKHKIPNVVIGCIDDNPLVAGKGIAKLKQASCNVIVGVLEAACKEHHKRFFTFHNKKRPYIILKWAETLDGFIAPETKNEQKPVWITNVFSRQLVHKWRAEEQAILVGTNTVLQDNPQLTVRDWTGQNPIRIVLDKRGILVENSNNQIPNSKTENQNKNINSKNQIPNQNINSKNQIPNSKVENWNLQPSNWNLEFKDWNLKLMDWNLKTVCDLLYKKNINSVVIEGGAKTLQLFIDEHLWDEARVFTGDILLKKGIKAPRFSGRLISEESILNDTLKSYKND